MEADRNKKFVHPPTSLAAIQRKETNVEIAKADVR